MSRDQTHDCDKADEKIIQDVHTVGWSVVMIPGSDYLPDFAYTIGLWKSYEHPEIIAFGLPLKTLHLTLNIAGENIKAGKAYTLNQEYSEFFENCNAQFLNVDRENFKDYFGYAIWFNKGSEFPALQLVWPDKKNLFPWEDGFEQELSNKQPLTDRNAQFKFREDKNLAVFTTRQCIEGKPILHVVHDEDGDWQFLTGDQLPEDGRLVTLANMISKDMTLNDLFNLDYGEEAIRTSPGEKWTRQPSILED